MKRLAALVLATFVIAAPVLADTYGGPWPTDAPGAHAKGPVAAPVFFAKHVARMKFRHPGVRLEASGYQYISSGVAVTGEQVRVPGGVSRPCWYLATVAENENGPAQMYSASCRGN